MNKNTALINLLLFCSLVSVGQTTIQENPIYAKATEQKSTTIDLTSKDVFKKYYGINGEEVKTLANANTIRIIKKNAKELFDVNEFYADGFLKMEGTFLNLKEEQKHGQFKYYRINGKLDSEGFYENDAATGEWKFYFPSGAMSGIEVYEKGICTKRKYWNEDGSEQNDYKLAEKLLPTYEGGQEKINDFIRRNITIPSEITKNKSSKKIVVSFWVDESGSVVSPKIEESLNPSIDNQVIKLVSSMSNWKPARQHNRPFKQMYILPITIGYY
jgi:antitoxin component YwqK of YwqJK toxin-antitoxin module